MIKVVFLDRDGVINKYPGDREYVKSWEEFSFLPGVFWALQELKSHGFKLFIISNQAGVSKGVYSQENLDLITKNMLNECKKEGIILDGVYYCTHQPKENCPCRKPKAGLLDLALSNARIAYDTLDLGHSYFIGDSILDVQTGKARGVKTILLLSGREKIENQATWDVAPDYIVEDLSEAARLVSGI